MNYLALKFSALFLGSMALGVASATAAPMKPAAAKAEFSLIDSNRDGTVQLLEFARSRLDFQTVTWRLKTATWLEFTRIDSDGNEELSQDEWVNYRVYPSNDQLVDQLRRFRQSDRNGDGKLSASETRAAFQPRLTSIQSVALVTSLDSDGDHLLTLGEFFRYTYLGEDSMRGLRRRDAEDLLSALGATFNYSRFNGAVVDYFAEVHGLYWLTSDADVITSCGYGIDLESLVGRTDAEAVKAAELAGLIPASPMFGTIPVDNPTVAVVSPEARLRIMGGWDNTHPIPLNDGGTFPLHPYLVIYARAGVVQFCSVTMGSRPYPVVWPINW
jgi:Ca2+-binding EF-hand superfamily protein